MKNQEEINKLINSLAKSKFRGSFHLNHNMIEYCKTKTLTKIEKDAYEIITKRIVPANPKNDGKQTPMRANSHPVFIAQHACGICCRGCLERIHHIAKNKELTQEEVDYLVKVIMTWIKKELVNGISKA